MVGMLMALLCMVILFALLMTALNKSVTGEGSQQAGTVYTEAERLMLYYMFQSVIVSANDSGGRFITPSDVSGRGDPSENTTANLFSAMVMQQYMKPENLVSRHENNPNVWPIEDYDYLSHNPSLGVFWDPKFKADLTDLSHVSFAHMPLFGERYDKQWRNTLSHSFPIFGSRGPRNGDDDPNSYTYGRDGRWAGFVVYPSGNVDLINTFTPPNVVFERGGERYQDNIFRLEDGEAGGDAILSFTKTMFEDGPELQFD
jgi:hypothetical protein